MWRVISGMMVRDTWYVVVEGEGSYSRCDKDLITKLLDVEGHCDKDPLADLFRHNQREATAAALILL
jgi:hypothetical protein